MSEISNKDFYGRSNYSSSHFLGTVDTEGNCTITGPICTIDDIAYSISGTLFKHTFKSLNDVLEIDNWNDAYSAKHTHSNQEVLDGITSTKVSNWDSASTNSHTHSNKSVLDNLTQTVIDNSHTHSNKSVLDGITSTKVSNWDSAFTNSHTHSNKSVLDSITADKISQWDKGTVPNDGKLTIKMNGAAVTGSFTANQATDSVIDLGTVVTNVTKATEIAASSTDAQYPSAKAVYTFVNTKTSTLESTDNKTQSVTEKSTETQYPSAKAVYDAIQAKECIVQTVDTEKHTVTINGTNVYYQLGLDDAGKLSLSITAADTPKTTVTITAPTTITSLTYTGSPLSLVNAGSCSPSSAAHLQYRLSTDSSYTTTIPTQINAGSYITYWQAVLDDSSKYQLPTSGTDGYLTTIINKADITFTNPTLASGLKYTGSAQKLISKGASTNISSTIYYNTSASDTGATTSYTGITGTTVGDYSIYCKAVVEEKSNYNNMDWKKVGTVSIAEKESTSVTITAPTAITGLTYTGSARTLANEAKCSVSGGATIKYGLTSSTITSDTVPTGINASDYTVYWKATANTGYTISGTSSGSVKCTIAAKSLQITAPSGKVLTYTGKAQELVDAGSSENPTDAIKWTYKLSTESDYSTAIPTGTNAGDYTVDYKATIVNSNYTIASYGTEATGSVGVTISAAATDYGYYALKLTDYNNVNTLVASDFSNKLTGTETEIDPSSDGIMITVASPNNTVPTYQLYSTLMSKWSSDQGMYAPTEINSSYSNTITISGKKYYIWQSALNNSANAHKIKITIK